MISVSWFVFNCTKLDDGTSQLMPAPHLSCYDDAWQTARVYAISTLTLWGILLPLLLALALRLARSRLSTAEFSRKFALLTFGYKRECVWWEVLLMMQKFLVSGCIVLFREVALVQCTLTLATMLAFLCFAVGVRPFLNRLISAICVLGEVCHRARKSNRSVWIRQCRAFSCPPGMPCMPTNASIVLLLAGGHIPYARIRDAVLDPLRVLSRT